MKKYALKWNLFLSLAVLMITACTKQNADTNSVNLPVVEAYLIPGHSLSVKLYQQKSLTDTAKYGQAITGLSVYVSDGSKNVQLTESPAGTYTYSDQSFLVTGKTYTLQFKYLTYTVSAKTVMPGKPTNFATQYGTITISTTSGPGTNNTTLDELSWDNPDTLNDVLVFNNLDGSAFPINAFSENRPVNFEINTNRASFFNVTQAIFPYYGHYQIVLLRVNQEYIDLIQGNTSSSTSQNLTSLPTNIINGFGIFTAMQADTLNLNVF